jgi:hypothetical protein
VGWDGLGWVGAPVSDCMGLWRSIRGEVGVLDGCGWGGGGCMCWVDAPGGLVGAGLCGGCEVDSRIICGVGRVCGVSVGGGGSMGLPYVCSYKRLTSLLIHHIFTFSRDQRNTQLFFAKVMNLPLSCISRGKKIVKLGSLSILHTH